MEMVIVGGIVAAAAGVLVAQFRRKLRGNDCSCDGEGSACSGCVGKCGVTASPTCRSDGAPPAESSH